MTDKLLALFALAILAAFLLTIVVFVPEPDLTIVTVLTLSMAGFDFYRTIFRKRNRSNR